MVSFGFLGTPTTISIKEYQMLAKFGFNAQGQISDNFHNKHYAFLPDVSRKSLPNSEKKVTNICRFLNVDTIVEPGVNSILNITLKADVVILHGEYATYFQAKSSIEGMENYQTKYFGMSLSPFYQKGGRYQDFKEKSELSESYPAPGALYLNTKYGDSSLPKFLRKFSEWVNIPVKEDYQKLLTVMLRATKPLSAKILEQAFRSDSYVMERVTHWGTIYPIDIKDGYVQLRRQRQTIR